MKDKKPEVEMYRLIVADAGKSLHDKIKRLAKKEQRTMAKQIKFILEKYFENKND